MPAFSSAEVARLKKILIVDESREEIRRLQAVLSQAGYWSVAVSDATTIEQIIDIIHPGLILMDVVMPQRNGFQACRELKRNTAYGFIPVVILSARTGDSERAWAEQQGADAFVPKPFTGEQLLGTVQKFL